MTEKNSSLCKKFTEVIFKYKLPNIIHRSEWSFVFIIFGLLYLFLFYSYKLCNGKCNNYLDVLSSSFDKLHNFLDPVSSIMTFFTTLVIFYMQAKSKWENSIEKRLTVSYIYVGNEGSDDDIIIAKIIDAYLPSESDTRAWAQSLGNQIMGNLDFDMHWDEQPPNISFNSKLGSFVKRYKLKVYLTTDPRYVIKDGEKVENEKYMNFRAKKFKHSSVSVSEDGVTLLWTEKF